MILKLLLLNTLMISLVFTSIFVTELIEGKRRSVSHLHYSLIKRLIGKKSSPSIHGGFISKLSEKNNEYILRSRYFYKTSFKAKIKVRPL